jgi:biotin transport system substrate-specific component
MFMKRNISLTPALSIPHERASIQAFWVLTFSILTAIGAQIEIPTQPVPFTLQTFFVLLSGAILGKHGGVLSMGVYLVLGAIGAPVFSGGTLGISRILGPTGGYLLAFPLAAFAVGYFAQLRSEYWWMLFSMVIGSLIIFVVGTVHLNFMYLHNWTSSFQVGFLMFSWWDAVKILSAAAIAHYDFRRVRLS